jgi:hypothetical protein
VSTSNKAFLKRADFEAAPSVFELESRNHIHISGGVRQFDGLSNEASDVNSGFKVGTLESARNVVIDADISARSLAEKGWRSSWGLQIDGRGGRQRAVRINAAENRIVVQEQSPQLREPKREVDERRGAPLTSSPRHCGAAGTEQIRWTFHKDSTEDT